MARAELISFMGCPYILKAQSLLRGAGIDFIETSQELLPDSDPRRNYSSPTVFYDGKLIFGRENAAFECTTDWTQLEKILASLPK